MKGAEPYRQSLPDLELSIERLTEGVPNDGFFYLILAGEQIGRYRSLKEAQTAWRGVIQESGWKPVRRSADATEFLRRERAERWSRDRAG